MKLFILGPLYDALGICTVAYRNGERLVTDKQDRAANELAVI
jgi:hypothetical protein